MKKQVKLMEIIFDSSYLMTCFLIACYALINHINNTAIMALVLFIGDSFHLIPRIATNLNPNSVLKTYLGQGKMLTSITMALFYLILWYLAKSTYHFNDILLDLLIYLLVISRIVLCLLPQNDWQNNRDNHFNLYRNIPFMLEGIMVAILFLLNQSIMFIAIVLSFAFYLPVVFKVKDYPKLGMLMLPKSLMYLWILIISLNI